MSVDSSSLSEGSDSVSGSDCLIDDGDDGETGFVGLATCAGKFSVGVADWLEFASDKTETTQ